MHFESRFRSSYRRLLDIREGWIADYHRFHGSKGLGFFPDAEDQILNLDNFIKDINEKSQRLLEKVSKDPAKISKLQLFADKILENVRKYDMADEKVQTVKQMPTAYDPEASIQESINASYYPHLRRI